MQQIGNASLAGVSFLLRFYFEPSCLFHPFSDNVPTHLCSLPSSCFVHELWIELVVSSKAQAVRCPQRQEVTFTWSRILMDFWFGGFLGLDGSCMPISTCYTTTFNQHSKRHEQTRNVSFCKAVQLAVRGTCAENRSWVVKMSNTTKPPNTILSLHSGLMKKTRKDDVVSMICGTTSNVTK